MKCVIFLASGCAALTSVNAISLKGQSDLGNYKASSEALTRMLAECGEHIGDGSKLDLQVGDGSGSCPDNGDCSNFYTGGNLFQAIDDFNLNKALEDQFPSEVQGSRCLTLAAFLGQTYFESANYRACKEYVAPCPPGKSCSGGRASDYNPANQRDWSPNTLPGTDATGPSAGCTDYWGNKQQDSSNCWFGRGAIQLTWLPNYVLYTPEYINDPDQICTLGKAGWKGSVAYWQALRSRFTGSCESATSIPSPAICDAACHQARCDEQNKLINVLQPRTNPPTPPPPLSGSYVVPADVAAGGCWKIMDTICPGQGNSWSENLCTPTHAPNVCPPIKGGDTIQYNCNGCSA